MNVRAYLSNLEKRIPRHPNARTRLIFLVAGTVAVLFLSRWFTGAFIPSDSREANIFQGGILLVIFGSLFLEDKFTKPADAVVNAIAATVSLIPVYQTFGAIGRLAVSYCAGVGFVGVVNLAIGETPPNDLWARLKHITYHISTTLGKSNIIFSIVFLSAVFSFYGIVPEEAGILVLFWAIYIALWPLKIPHIIQALFSTGDQALEKGSVLRVDDPDLVRVKLRKGSSWQGDMIACLGDEKKRKVIPLYTQVQDEQVVGTGLLLGEVEFEGRTRTGGVYQANSADDAPEHTTNPVGFVVENSRIAKIFFETWRPQDLRQGLLVYCQVDDQTIYYQIADAATVEETFDRHKHGFQVVEAHQLGILDSTAGFKKFNWVPTMNTPVYLAGSSIQTSPAKLPTWQMSLGTVPGSDIEVVCDINDMISHHTAILGVTGAGKTELAYMIIRRAMKNDGVKIVCVDTTEHYDRRLCDLNPLLITARLHKQGIDLKKEIEAEMRKFLEGDSQLAVLKIPFAKIETVIGTINNYLMALFEYMRQNRDATRVFVVLEEAQTVIPEPFTMGLDSVKSMVANIAQIALQGRKYNVGLLIIAQRTATVSKLVLTQCNTLITFATFDEKALEFLSTVYSEEFSSKIPSLPSLHALAFGKGVKSERPVIVEIHRLPDPDSSSPLTPPAH